MKILVTGAAVFIGFHLSKLLLDQGFNVIGLTNKIRNNPTIINCHIWSIGVKNSDNFNI